jgi:hypothetical protein
VSSLATATISSVAGFVRSVSASSVVVATISRIASLYRSASVASQVATRAWADVEAVTRVVVRAVANALFRPRGGA